EWIAPPATDVGQHIVFPHPQGDFAAGAQDRKRQRGAPGARTQNRHMGKGGRRHWWKFISCLFGREIYLAAFSCANSPEFLHLVMRAFLMRRFFLCAMAAVSIALLGGAGQPVPQRQQRPFSDQEKAELDKVSAYLNAIKSLKA